MGNLDKGKKAKGKGKFERQICELSQNSQKLFSVK